MALPILAPALFFIGGQIVKAGSKKIGEHFLKQGAKRATTSQIKNAKGARYNVNTLKQADDVLTKGVKKTNNKQAKAALGTLGAAGIAAVATSKPANKTNQAKATTTTEGRMRRSKGRTPDRSKDTAERQAKRDASKMQKTWKDYKTVSSAKKAGLDYFMGKDGKKKVAVTKEELDKKKMSLTEYANSLRRKK